MVGKFLAHLPTTSGSKYQGWSGGAKVLGKLPVPVRLTNLDYKGQGPIALAVGAGGDFDIFFSRQSFPFRPVSGRRPDVD